MLSWLIKKGSKTTASSEAISSSQVEGPTMPRVINMYRIWPMFSSFLEQFAIGLISLPANQTLQAHEQDGKVVPLGKGSRLMIFYDFREKNLRRSFSGASPTRLIWPFGTHFHCDEAVVYPGNFLYSPAGESVEFATLPKSNGFIFVLELGENDFSLEVHDQWNPTVNHCIRHAAASVLRFLYLPWFDGSVGNSFLTQRPLPEHGFFVSLHRMFDQRHQIGSQMLGAPHAYLVLEIPIDKSGNPEHSCTKPRLSWHICTQGLEYPESSNSGLCVFFGIPSVSQ